MNKASEKALQRIIVVVDELAELMDAGGANKEEKAVIQSINRNLRTLARIARVLGVHLLLGIQRPDSSIIDGQVKEVKQPVSSTVSTHEVVSREKVAAEANKSELDLDFSQIDL